MVVIDGISLGSGGGLAAVGLTPTEVSVLWGLHHPYWLVAIAITLIILLQLIISLAAQLLRRSVKWLSKSPLFVGRWLLAKTPFSTTDDLQQQQLVMLLTRLETLQQEQVALLTELQTTLSAREQEE